MCSGCECEFYFIDEFDYENCLSEENCKHRKIKKIVDLDGESEYYGE